MLSIGLMSGTSMDGIDAALLKTSGSPNDLEDLAHLSLIYSNSFKILLKAAEFTIKLFQGDLNAAHDHYFQNLQNYLQTEFSLSSRACEEKLKLLRNNYGELSLSAVIQESTRLHAQLVKNLLHQAGYTSSQIDVVGYHGQTMFHAPKQKISIIVGDGQLLANQVDIKVVADFRSQDIAFGGQGAPFAPLYHYALALRDQKIPVAIVNCGGIANITLITSDQEQDLLAFDTGPGNGLIDKLVRQRTSGRETMDQDGRYGKKGKVHADVLTALFERAIVREGQNYFAMTPPKALDIGDMQLISELESLSLEDACATLETFTAESIVRSIDLIDTDIPHRWILAGGGWHNPVITEVLQSALRKKNLNALEILTAEQAGWNNQAMEAQIFAYLAVRSVQGKYLSLPNTTGVSKPLCGGRVFVPKVAE